MHRHGEPLLVRKDGRSWPVVDLIADFLRELKEAALARVRAAAEVEEREVLWCLTIPAIWRDAEKTAMRRAAERAGLVDGRSAGDDRLLLVLEPEAAAMHCQKKELFRRESGTRFMVVDCGGGHHRHHAHECSLPESSPRSPRDGRRARSALRDAQLIAFFSGLTRALMDRSRRSPDRLCGDEVDWRVPRADQPDSAGAPSTFSFRRAVR